jgi:hypothetical protein
MPLMASVLLGNKSIISSKLFHYVFPHVNVSYVNSLLQSDSNLSHDENVKSSCSWMRTMNMLNRVLMQSWKQFGKMMITMSFVGAQILIKQRMTKSYP